MRRFFHRMAHFFGLGSLPAELKRQVELDGELLFFEENVPVTLTFRDYIAPGVISGMRKTLVFGGLALSRRRVVVSAGEWHKAELSLAYDDPRFEKLSFSLSRNRLVIGFEAEGLIPGASGRVILRLYLLSPGEVMEHLGRLGVLSPERRMAGASGSGVPVSG